MTIERTAQDAGHVFRFIASNDVGGWHIRQLCDAVTIMDVVRRTWQQVESDLALFERQHPDRAPRAA